MMNKMCMAAIIAASLYAGTTFAQPAAVKKIIETGQTDNRVMHQLDILTNRFGGRVIGSDAYENAAEWMMREYKRWGQHPSAFQLMFHAVQLFLSTGLYQNMPALQTFST